MKKHDRVRHYDCGIWRKGEYVKKSESQPHLCVVIFDDAPLLGGEQIPELVRIDELKVESGGK